jgi:primosomal protein N' (replication factor Y)
MASVTSSRERLAPALERIRAIDGVDVLGPVPVDDGLERAIVRFGYGAGAEVAAALKAEAIRTSTERRRPVAGRRPGRPPILRVRMDDPDLP